MDVQFRMTSASAEVTASEVRCPACGSTDYLIETISTKFEGRVMCVSCETPYHISISTVE